MAGRQCFRGSRIADQDALQAGLASEEGKATAADFAATAAPGSRLFVVAAD